MMNDYSIAPKCLHISDYGKRLRRYKGMLKVDWKENGEELSMTFSPASLKQIIISGEHTITTGAFGILLKHGIDLVILDSYGKPLGYLFPASKGQMLNIWDKQMEIDEIRCLDVSKKIVEAACVNKVSILADVERNRNLDLGKYTGKMLDLVGGISDAGARNVLMGIEGAVSNEYFKALQSFISEDMGFIGRFRRPSPDVVNVMLNYGYGILYSFIRNAISSVGLNPYRGVLHASYKDQEALVYDLIEEFRQPVVDKVVITMIGRKQVSKSDFSVKNGVCTITDGFRREFADNVLSRIEYRVLYEERKERFENIIKLQAQCLKNAILDGTGYKPYTYKRR